MLPQYYDWTKANGDSIAQFSFITGVAGCLYPYPASALPAGIANGMPDVTQCYISGYATPQAVEGGVDAIGEILVTRLHDQAMVESGKAYMYLVAVDQNNEPWFRGPYKPYGPHYYSLEDGVPTGQLFGQINLKNLGKINL